MDMRIGTLGIVKQKRTLNLISELERVYLMCHYFKKRYFRVSGVDIPSFPLLATTKL